MRAQANVSSSWIGPLISAAIIESAGIRHVFWFLATQFFIPAVMMIWVDGKHFVDLYCMDFQDVFCVCHSYTKVFLIICVDKIVEKGRLEAIEFYNKEQAAKKNGVSGMDAQDGVYVPDEKEAIKSA